MARSIRNHRTSTQLTALIIGSAFLVIGILGFAPGATTHYDMLESAGKQSGAKLFGLFEVSILHNVIHLLFGVAGVVLSRTVNAAKVFLLGGGLIYLLLTAYGLVIELRRPVNFIPLNTADNWAHFGLSATMLGLGLTLGRGRGGRAERH